MLWSHELCLDELRSTGLGVLRRLGEEQPLAAAQVSNQNDLREKTKAPTPRFFTTRRQRLFKNASQVWRVTGRGNASKSHLRRSASFPVSRSCWMLRRQTKIHSKKIFCILVTTLCSRWAVMLCPPWALNKRVIWCQQLCLQLLAWQMHDNFPQNKSLILNYRQVHLQFNVVSIKWWEAHKP